MLLYKKLLLMTFGTTLVLRDETGCLITCYAGHQGQRNE